MDLAISKDNRLPVYRRIVEAIGDQLASGNLTPGQRLPSEATLAATLGLNRLTVRQAYQELQRNGVILQRRGSGSFITADALQQLERLSRSQAGGRPIRRLFIHFSEASLGKCPEPVRFIMADFLDGLSDTAGDLLGKITFFKEWTPAYLQTLQRDDALILGLSRPVDNLAHAIDLMQRQVRVISRTNEARNVGVPHLGYDRRQAAALACQHLVDAGYRRIGYLGRQKTGDGSAYPKFLSFVSVMALAGLDIQARHMRNVESIPGKAYAAMRDILASGDMPEAFFVDTDYKAMEAISALDDAGLRVPQDVGIVGYDDIPESSVFTPALTTVHTPRYELGKQAAQMLLNWAEGLAAPKDVILPAKLVIRDSTRHIGTGQAGEVKIITNKLPQ